MSRCVSASRFQLLLLGAILFMTFSNYILAPVIYSLLSSEDSPEPASHLLKALFYNFFDIATDTKVYASEKDNVLWYSTFNLKALINNPDKCKNRKPFIVIFAKTVPEHFKERSTIRKTWGNLTSWKQIDENHDVLILFMLGLSKTHTKDLQANLEKENEEFEDLIQEDFVEDFHNLSIKLISQFKWGIQYCPSAKFWMTTDTDVFVHVGNLITHLKNIKPQSFYSGLVHVGSPRNIEKQTKYFVPYNVYRGAYYPDYCPGAGYVLSMDVVEKLFIQAHNMPMLYIDDAYAGILAYSAGIAPRHYAMFFGEKTVSNDLCTLSKFITSHGHKGVKMFSLFKTVMSLGNLDPDILCWGKFFSWVNPNDLVFF